MLFQKGMFKPHRVDDLRPELESLIGEIVEWYVGWVMEEDDSFPGETAYLTYDERFMGYWVPSRDITFI